MSVFEPCERGRTDVRVSTLPLMQGLPDGVVTFLSTDVEGSTHAWEKSPQLVAEALVQHDEASTRQ